MNIFQSVVSETDVIRAKNNKLLIQVGVNSELQLGAQSGGAYSFLSNPTIGVSTLPGSVNFTGGVNVAGVSTFADDIFVGTGATVGFGSTAYFNHNVVVASDKSLSIGGKLSTRYISAINSVFQTNTADQFISVSDSFTLQALNGKKLFKAGISGDTGLYLSLIHI